MPGKTGKYKCHGCDFVTNLSQDMIIHIQIKHDSGFQPFKCAICDFESLWEAPLYRHVELEHSKKPKFSCDLCVFITDDEEALQDHNKYLHPPEDPMKMEQTEEKENFLYTCSQCNFTTQIKSDLEFHVYQRHENVQKSNELYTCDICPFVTEIEKDLKRHSRLKHKQVREYKCPMCDYKSPIQPNVKRHYLTMHEKVRAFKCDFCPKEYTTKSMLQTHMATKHDFNAPKYKCDVCDFTTPHRNSMNRHKLVVQCSSKLVTHI